MQKELYQIERSEVSLNISEGAVTEVRRKHIVRSGCRVYDGGKLGISGVFGEPDEATWQAAQRACTASPSTGGVPGSAALLVGRAPASWQLAQLCGSGSMFVSAWWQEVQSTPKSSLCCWCPQSLAASS